MKGLLDTQPFLYSIAEPTRLPPQVRAVIEDLENDIIFSVASAWEIAIKISIGKLTLARPLEQLIRQQLETATFSLLPISLEHVTVVAGLPFHHRDPFDRMLVAQSIVEGVPIISGDPAFDHYGIERIW